MEQASLNCAGDNLLSDLPGNVLMASRMLRGNPGFCESLIAELYAFCQGFGRLYLYPRFPRSKDSAGHVDMWNGLRCVDLGTCFDLINFQSILCTEPSDLSS